MNEIDSNVSNVFVFLGSKTAHKYSEIIDNFSNYALESNLIENTRSIIDLRDQNIEFLNANIFDEFAESGGLNIVFLYCGGVEFQRGNKAVTLYGLNAGTDEAQDLLSISRFIRRITQSFSCMFILDVAVRNEQRENFMQSDGPAKIIRKEVYDLLQVPVGKAVVVGTHTSDEQEGCRLFSSFIDIVGQKNGESIFTKISLFELVRRLRSTISTNSIDHSWQISDVGRDPVALMPFIPVANDRSGSVDILHSSSKEHDGALTDREELLLHVQNGAAQTIHSDLLRSLDISGIGLSTYAITSRVKSPRNVSSKIVRKRTEEKKEGYSVGNVTDIIGLRFITLFKEDMPNLCHKICDIISGVEDLSPNPFSESDVQEAIIYTSESKAETGGVASRCEQILRGNLGEPKLGDVHIKYRGSYSSIHLVLLLQTEEVYPNTTDPICIPVEIQLRSVFEDVWAQIDHKLRYSITRASDFGGRSTSVPASAENHLKILKNYLDSTASYSDNILRELTEQRGSVVELQSSIDDEDLFRNVAVRMEVDERKVRELDEILQQKYSLDKQFDYEQSLPIGSRNNSELAAMSRDYATLAEQLNRLYLKESSAGGYLSNGRDEEAANGCFRYYIGMEEALCRLRAYEDGEVEQAVSIYHDLEALFEEYPMVYFRMGQALGHLGRHEEAINAFKKCKQVVDGLKDHNAPKLSTAQAKYISNNICRLLGFHTWRLADLISRDDYSKLDIPGIIDGYTEALKHTQKGLEGRSGSFKIRLLSNRLDYLRMHIEFADSATERFPEVNVETLNAPSKEQLNSALHDLEVEIEGAEDDAIRLSPRILDSLMCAYEVLGHQEKAAPLAVQILDILLDDDPFMARSPYEQEAVGRMRARAWQVRRIMQRK